MFSHEVVRTYFDQLHHIQTNVISLPTALDLMIFLNYEGQIDQKSDFEIRLFQELSDHVLSANFKPKELCFIWMYLR